MAKPSSINPENFFNYQKLKYPIACLSDTKSNNDQHLEIVEITKRDWNITVRKMMITLNSAALINNIHPNKMNLNNDNSQVLFDVTQLFSLAFGSTTFQSWKYLVLSRIRSSLTPTAINYPCRKVSDGQPGNPFDRSPNNAYRVDINNATEQQSYNNSYYYYYNYYNYYKNNNDDDDDPENEGNGYDPRDIIRVEPITVYWYDKNQRLIKTIKTIIIADFYNSWEEVSGDLYSVWHEESNQLTMYMFPYLRATMHPAICWPKCITVFGRIDGMQFTDLNWPRFSWESVRAHVNCLIAIEDFRWNEPYQRWRRLGKIE